MAGYWKNKVALITGGTSGLGRAIAEQFLRVGAKICVVGLESDLVHQTAAALAGQNGRCAALQADITEEKQAQHIVSETLARFGRLDVLVNCAGRSMRGPAWLTTVEQFKRLMELNFFALVRCTQAALPHLIETKGHIINIGSLAAKCAARWVGAYAASKFAVAAFSQQLRLELAPFGVHVLLVCPGPLRRNEPRLYPLEGVDTVPDRAKQPGAGVRIAGICPHRLAAAILRACQKRKAELVVPRTARLLFAISQLFPKLGDWLILRAT